MTADKDQPDTPRSEAAQEIREGLPFLAVLLLVMLFVYVSSLRDNPVLHTPQRLIPFTALLLLHAGLHVGGFGLPLHPRLTLPYFAVQTGLVLAIFLMSAGQGVVLGLYLALAGEAVGVLEDVRRATPAVVLILGVAALSYGLALGWDSLPGWLAVVLPMAVFVVVYVTMFSRQVRGRQEAQKLLRQLESAHQQLAGYALRVEELTLAAERQRMARELHDTLAQGLAGLILQLEAADSNLVRGDAGKTQEIIRQAMVRARSTLADARRAIDQLRLEADRPVDLEQAIRQEAIRFSTATGVPCDVQIALPADVPQAQCETAARAVSEALSNAARHASASHVWLVASPHGKSLVVTIKDDGAGFDPARVDPRAGHYGLLGLEERARSAGGSFEVASTPGEGTTVRLVLPLDHAGSET